MGVLFKMPWPLQAFSRNHIRVLKGIWVEGCYAFTGKDEVRIIRAFRSRILFGGTFRNKEIPFLRFFMPLNQSKV